MKECFEKLPHVALKTTPLPLAAKSALWQLKVVLLRLVQPLQPHELQSKLLISPLVTPITPLYDPHIKLPLWSLNYSSHGMG